MSKDAKDLVNEIQDVLSKTKAQGQESVSIDAMNNYLDSLKTGLNGDSRLESMNHEIVLANFKAENDRNIAHANNETAHSLEMFKSVITAGQSALKASMVVNGGAAIALLAFTGKIWETSTSEDVANSLTLSILIFCVGVLSGAFATGTTYLAQYAFSREWLKLGGIINSFNIIIVLSSYVLFAFGAYTAATALGFHFA